MRTVEHYWKHPPSADRGRPWGPQEKTRVIQLLLSTDASKVAWGAHVHGKWASSSNNGVIQNHLDEETNILEFPEGFPNELRNMRGNFSKSEQEDHIHILEYEAVFRALLALGHTISDTCIRLWCDNTTVVAGLKKEFSAKPAI